MSAPGARERRRIEREASFAMIQAYIGKSGSWNVSVVEKLEEERDRMFPPLRKSVPRVERDPHDNDHEGKPLYWTAFPHPLVTDNERIKGVFECDADRVPARKNFPGGRTPERIRLWADLEANPNRYEVDDE